MENAEDSHLVNRNFGTYKPALYTWGSCSHSSEGWHRSVALQRDASRGRAGTGAFGVPLQNSPLRAQLSRPSSRILTGKAPPPLAFGAARFFFFFFFFKSSLLLLLLEKQHLVSGPWYRPEGRCQYGAPFPHLTILRQRRMSSTAGGPAHSAECGAVIGS